MEPSKNSKALKALKEIIGELNKIVEILDKENKDLIKENDKLKSKLQNITEIISV